MANRPNALARMLVTQRTDILAVVFQRGYFFTSWSSFTAEVMKGVSTAAVELGYDLMLHTKDVPIEQEAQTLADGRVDGALVLRDEEDPVVGDLARQNFPCVRFFTRSSDDTPYVDADNLSGGLMATQHLIDLGHRRIGVIRGPEHSTSSNDRLAGYRRAYAEAGFQARLDWEIQIDTAMSDMSALRELMRTPDHPTALFVWSDDVAMACITLMHELGLSVPRDVSIVGFDSLEICSRSVPPLTSVRQPVFEMAQKATQILVALIRGHEVADRQVLFPLQLDLRASTAPCHESPSQR
jgi:LacI family transcriptional regulator